MQINTASIHRDHRITLETTIINWLDQQGFQAPCTLTAACSAVGKSPDTTARFNEHSGGMMHAKSKSIRWKHLGRGLMAPAILGLAIHASAQPSPLPAGVEKVCSIQFDTDTRYPARVENGALPCLQQAVKSLKDNPAKKLVLIGTADIKNDVQAVKNGQMRETEDETGADVRFEDLAAYRAVNTKGYLVRWLNVDPARVLPTTNEWIDGQYATFYLVPGDADFNHNYLETTKTNENPCTVKPCYTPDEESLKVQPRSRIPEEAKKEPGN
jgi:hypothetical protein